LGFVHYFNDPTKIVGSKRYLPVVVVVVVVVTVAAVRTMIVTDAAVLHGVYLEEVNVIPSCLDTRS
jgi:hypothetical protein